MQKEIFEIQFDPTSFNNNIDKALVSLAKLETQSGESALAVKALAGSVAGVSFSRPAGEILRLNTALSQVNIATLKLDTSQEALARSTKLNEIAMRTFGNTVDKVARSSTTFYQRIKNAIKGVQDFTKETAKGVKSSATFGEKVSSVFGNLAGALGITAGIAGLVQLTKSMVNITAEMQKYKAVLTNTLGSSELATNALATITKFAAQTPFAVTELTNAFVKLANQGFVPTIEELRKLGDLASSTGKDFNMLAEAILDAQTGEFERLKEFGIKGKVNGDKVTFAFKGIRTEIDNNAESIRKYIIGLGDLKGVEGAMEAISKTLTGQISNLGDAWDQLLVSIGNNAAGVFSAIIAGISSVLVSIKGLNDSMTAIDKYGNGMSIFDFVSNPTKATRDLIKGGIMLGIEDSYRSLKENLVKGADSYQDYTDAIVKVKQIGEDAIKGETDKGIKTAIRVNARFQILAIRAERDKWVETQKIAMDRKPKIDKALLKLEEAYWKKLQQMRSALSAYKFENSPKSKEAIEAEYGRLLEIEKAEIAKQFERLGKLKVLTMQAEAFKMSKARTKTTVYEFKLSQADALNGINRAITDQEFAIREKKIALMQEGFDKENEATQLEYDKQISEIKRNEGDKIKAVEGQIKSGELTIEDGLNRIVELQEESTKSLELIEQDSYQKRLANLQKFYEDMLGITDAESAKRVAKDSEAIAEIVMKESERYAKGEITYEQYERNIARKQSEFKRTELDTQLTNQEQSLMLLQESLRLADEATKTSIETKIATTKEGISKTQTEINTLNKGFSSPVDSLIGKAFGIDPSDPKSQEDIDKFKSAVTNAISETAKAVNQSLQAQIDADNRAIESQKRRVDEASRIASEGNAEYLQQEEERMRELEAKRDADARKQLAINAALQASQVLVSITGALASSGGEPIQVATKVATIIAALATGFALVSSLQSKTPSFFEGTDFVPLGNNKRGRDTVPAFLHEGEAVIQADRNKAYAPTIKAIRRGLLAPDILNGFVTGNQMNHLALGQALQSSSNSSFKESHFVEMNERLAGLEQVMLGTTRAVRQIGVNVNLDSDGFSLSIQKHLERKSKIWNA